MPYRNHTGGIDIPPGPNHPIQNNQVLFDETSPLPTFEKKRLAAGFRQLIKNTAFSVFSDGCPLLKDTLPEVLIRGKNPYKTSFDERGIHIAVYISTDGAQLMEMYENSTFHSTKEIHVFLEVNDQYNIAGSIMLLKATEGVMSDKKNIPFESILKVAKEKKISLSSQQIKNFLQEAIYQQERNDYFLFHLWKVVSFFNGIGPYIALEYIDVVFGEILPEIAERFLLDESRWNPQHKDYQTNSLRKAIQVDKLLKNGKGNVGQTLTNYFDAQIEEVEKEGTDFLILLRKNKIFSNDILSKVEKNWKELQVAIQMVRSELKKYAEKDMNLSSAAIDILIAYFCGLYNAIVDAIRMIYELIGMIAKAAQYMMEFGKNSARYALEQIENILEMMAKLEIKEYFNLIVEKGQALFQSIYILIKQKRLPNIRINDLISMAYFCGYIVGFILSILLQVFLTGGVAEVESLIQGVTSLGARLGRGLRHPLSEGTEAMRNIIAFLRTAYKTITSNAKQFFEDFKQWLDDLIEAVKKKFGLLDEIEISKSRVTQFNSISDPVADVLGSAFRSHYKRLNEIISVLKEKNVEIIYRETEALGYSPGISPGNPGQIIVHKEASISAWEHEYRHFLDDESAGFLGIKSLFDSNYRALTELNAYSVEIELIEKLNLKNKIELIDKLKNNFKNEIEYIKKNIGEVTDKKLLAKINNFLK